MSLRTWWPTPPSRLTPWAETGRNGTVDAGRIFHTAASLELSPSSRSVDVRSAVLVEDFEPTTFTSGSCARLTCRDAPYRRVPLDLVADYFRSAGPGRRRRPRRLA